MLATALALASCLSVSDAAIFTAASDLTSRDGRSASAFDYDVACLDGEVASAFDQLVTYSDNAAQQLPGKVLARDIFDKTVFVRLDTAARGLPPIAVRWPADKRKLKAVGADGKVLDDDRVDAPGQRVMYFSQYPDTESGLLGQVGSTPAPVPVCLDPIPIPKLFLKLKLLKRFPRAVHRGAAHIEVGVLWRGSEFHHMRGKIVDSFYKRSDVPDGTHMVQLPPISVQWPYDKLEVLFRTGQCVTIKQGLYEGESGYVRGDEFLYEGSPKHRVELGRGEVEVPKASIEATNGGNCRS